MQAAMHYGNIFFLRLLWKYFEIWCVCALNNENLEFCLQQIFSTSHIFKAIYWLRANFIITSKLERYSGQMISMTDM